MRGERGAIVDVDLTPIEHRIAEQQSTPEHARLVEAIREISSAIHGRVIAIDIEGTLMATNIPVSLGDFSRSQYRIVRRAPNTDAAAKEWHQKTTQERAARIASTNHQERYNSDHDGDYKRILRPLANETLAALARTDNEVFIWTGASRRRAELIIADAGLETHGLKVVTREDYLRALKEKSELVEGVIRTIRGDHPEGERLPFFKAEPIAGVRKGKVKLVDVLGADCLIDDHCGHEKTTEAALGNKLDRSRIIQITPYYFRSEEALNVADRDTGIHTAIQKMHRLLSST